MEKFLDKIKKYSQKIKKYSNGILFFLSLVILVYFCAINNNLICKISINNKRVISLLFESMLI